MCCFLKYQLQTGFQRIMAMQTNLSLGNQLVYCHNSFVYVASSTPSFHTTLKSWECPEDEANTKWQLGTEWCHYRCLQGTILKVLVAARMRCTHEVHLTLSYVNSCSLSNAWWLWLLATVVSRIVLAKNATYYSHYSATIAWRSYPDAQQRYAKL